MADRDFVDGILAQWKRERPDLDASPMAVAGRISRLESHLDRLMGATLARSGLSRGEASTS